MSPPPPSATLFPYTTLFRSPAFRGHLQTSHGAPPAPPPVSGPPRGETSARRQGVSSSSAGGRPSLRARRSPGGDRKSTRLNSSHPSISYAVFCLKKKMISRRECIVLSNVTAAPVRYTLSLHDALPISGLSGTSPDLSWSAASSSTCLRTASRRDLSSAARRLLVLSRR